MKTNNRLSIQVPLAITVGIVVTHLLKIDKPYWTLLTIILLICPRYEQTLFKSFLRIVSTILGSTLCGVTLWLFNYPQTYYILAGTGAYFIIYYGKISYFKSIFFASVMVIALFGIAEPWSWQIVSKRIFQTALGASIAIFVSIIITPDKNKRTYFATVQEILRQELLFYKEGSIIFFSYEKYWEILKKNRQNLTTLRKTELEIFFKKIITFRNWKNFHLSKILNRNLIIIADIFFVLNKINRQDRDFSPYLKLFHALVNKEFESLGKLLNLEIEFVQPREIPIFLPNDIDYLSILSFCEKLTANLRLTRTLICKNQNEA